MKIVNPSYEIIEDQLSTLSIHQRIDACAATCYQRPPKPTEEEAQAFCRSMVERGHYMTLEMAVVSLVVPAWAIPPPKYLHIDRLMGDWFVVTGSIRAFVENVPYNSPIQNFLSKKYPLFFTSPIEPEADSVSFARSHEIPPDHQHVAVRFVVNRAASHELVRHRPCSFLQESQRYVTYDDGVTFIEPEWYRKGELERLWDRAMADAEDSYLTLRDEGLSPQQARAVLPNSTKTELIAYASIPQWRHMFNLRCSKAADPEMRRIMIPLRDEMRERWEV